MAGVTAAPGTTSFARRGFWLAQAAHQAPMAGVMVLLVLTGGSVLAALLAVAALWIVALLRAGAARRSIPAREFLVDLLAMGLVVVVSLARGTHSQGVIAAAMPGMLGASLSLSSVAMIVATGVILAWAAARVALAIVPRSPGQRAGSVLSGSCCAVGLIAMLLM